MCRGAAFGSHQLTRLLLDTSPQVLAFPLSAAAPFHWHDMEAMKYISFALGAVSGDMTGLASAGLPASKAVVVLFAASASIVAIVIALFLVLGKIYADSEEF